MAVSIRCLNPYSKNIEITLVLKSLSLNPYSNGMIIELNSSWLSPIKTVKS